MSILSLLLTTLSMVDLELEDDDDDDEEEEQEDVMERLDPLPLAEARIRRRTGRIIAGMSMVGRTIRKKTCAVPGTF